MIFVYDKRFFPDIQRIIFLKIGMNAAAVNFN